MKVGKKTDKSAEIHHWIFYSIWGKKKGPPSKGFFPGINYRCMNEFVYPSIDTIQLELCNPLLVKNNELF